MLRNLRYFVTQKVQINYEPFDIETIYEEQCFIDFRFAKNDLRVLLDMLTIPDRAITTEGTVCNLMEVLCILLKPLLFPFRYSEMLPIFGKNPIELCLCLNYNSLINTIYDQHYHRLSSCNQPLLAPQQLQLHADVIH